jgi:hypothetical protein
MKPEMRSMHDLELWTGAISLLGIGVLLSISGATRWGMLSLLGAVATLMAIWLGRIRDKSK